MLRVFTFELGQDKSCLKIFFLVIPREELAGRDPSFGMLPTMNLYSVVLAVYISKSVSYQKKAWLQAFFIGMTLTKI